MANNIEYLHSNIISVLAKERELRGNGYREKILTDEYLLDCGEYLVRTPFHNNLDALQGWESISIVWCTS